MLFLRKKKKLDRNNIPVYKISFGNAFSIQKRLPWRNRWEKFLAFKQIPLTCLSNSKAFERHRCFVVWAVLWHHTAILARLAAFTMPSWLSKDAANVASHRSWAVLWRHTAILGRLRRSRWLLGYRNKQPTSHPIVLSSFFCVLCRSRVVFRGSLRLLGYRKMQPISALLACDAMLVACFFSHSGFQFSLLLFVL